jgi:uncharacterized RDD family membrane protein YckC
MISKLINRQGEWNCPRCGKRAGGIKCPACGFSIYAGFVPRFLASVVDGLIVWPFAYLFLFLRNQSLDVYEFVTILGFCFYRFYHIFFVARWGQTPGKMIARIKVVRLDGSPVGWREAFLRNSVETFLAAIVYFLELKAATHVSAVDYAAAAVSTRAALVQAFVPSYTVIISWLSKGYVMSEFVVLWLNRKKRAIHDFIAGTVIIHDPRLPLFPWRGKA